MKPILFNTEMIRAILDGKKTVTRRLIKPQPITITKDERNRVPVAFWVDNKEWVKPKYQVDDILYVRETWRVWDLDGKSCVGIAYKADDKKIHIQVSSADRYFKMGCYFDQEAWKPSIHMPREAARIFIKVTNVRVERLQDMTPFDAWKEGGRIAKTLTWEEHIPEFKQIYRDIWFKSLWNLTIKKKDIEQYGWDANPWVWVIEFEKSEGTP